MNKLAIEYANALATYLRACHEWDKAGDEGKITKAIQIMYNNANEDCKYAHRQLTEAADRVAREGL